MWPPAAATTASSLCRNDSSSSKLQKKTNKDSVMFQDRAEPFASLTKKSLT